MRVAPALLALATLAGAAVPARAQDAPGNGRIAEGRTVPAFSGTDLSGREWTHRALSGRVVLIDFWATWCAPCLAELPRLKTLRGRYPREQFEILGVNLDPTDRRTFVSWLNRQRVDWPQVQGRSGYAERITRAFDVDRLPRTVLVDRDGRIAALDARGERLEALVDVLVRKTTSARHVSPIDGNTVRERNR